MLGSKRAYGIFGAGIDPIHDKIRWSYGFGLGAHFPIRMFFVDVDLMAHIMQPDGSYEKQDLRGKVKLDSQMYFAEEARKRSAKPEDADAAISHDRVFIPIEAEESEH